MNLTSGVPATVVDYFDRIDGADRTAVISSFAPEAQVTDDGHVYRGREEIAGWLTGAAAEYVTTSTVLSADTKGEEVTVVVRVEGNFPGGRVDLRHVFALDADGQIDALTIAP